MAMHAGWRLMVLWMKASASSAPAGGAVSARRPMRFAKAAAV
jgi:hypothetical protein